jgi:hypothetical protein
MLSCDKALVLKAIKGKKVVIVGSGPGVLTNAPGFIDSHDVVIRVNNYKLSGNTGKRTDIHYSFYGNSIRKTANELIRDGVNLCMCKCPDAQFMESKWHRRMGKMNGVDFRYIYSARRGFWFCDTYIPTVDEFMRGFELLGKHIPTTGFSALLDVLECQPASVYLTGFDFFSSGVHNVDEAWKPGDPADPIGHVPDKEAQWLFANMDKQPIQLDSVLTELFRRNNAALVA